LPLQTMTWFGEYLQKMKRLVLAVFFFVFLFGPQKVGLNAPSQLEGEKIEEFSLSHRDQSGEWKILGKTALLSPDQKNTSIINPKITISDKKKKVLTLQTAEDGRAEFNIDEKTKRINSLIATKGVIIIQKDNQGEIIFKSVSEKAVYNGKEKVIILSGNPVVEQGKNRFQGEIIHFFIEENKIVIEGKVKGTVFPEEKD